jgi:serine/threonine-protein kinase
VTTTDLSAEELIDLVTRYQAAEPEPLWHYLAARGGAAALPADAAAVADDMVCAGLLTAYQAERLLAGDGRSLNLGRFRILDRLGERVFLGERRPGGLGKVAIKVLQSVQADRRGADRLRREAEALARIDHPGVVNIKEVGEDDGRLFLVTEHVEGRTFSRLVAERGPQAPVPATRLVRDAAQALAHAHEAGIVHCNLQPEHFMQDLKGGVRLIDLGLARFLDNPVDRLTLYRQPDGAPAGLEYLAPEVAIHGVEPDARANVYALGAIFYFLLTGKPPLSRQAVLRQASGVVTHPQPLAQLRPDLPRQLLAVAERMMAADPEARYPKMADAAEAVGAWLSEVAPTPLVQPRRSTTRVPVLKRPTALVPVVPPQLLQEPPPKPAAPPQEKPSAWPVLGMMVCVAGLVYLGVLIAWLFGR